MSPMEYRSLADTCRKQGREADADVCEIMAQERERMDAWTRAHSPDSFDIDDDPPPTQNSTTSHQLAIF